MMTPNNMMSSLHPRAGAESVSVDEAVRRANMEFGFVQCDTDRGMRYAAERLMKTAGNLSHDEKDLAMSLLIDTVEMIVGDDRRHDQHFLKCFVIPQGPVEIVYLYDSHARNTTRLLERLAGVLDYLIDTE